MRRDRARCVRLDTRGFLRNRDRTPGRVVRACPVRSLRRLFSICDARGVRGTMRAIATAYTGFAQAAYPGREVRRVFVLSRVDARRRFVAVTTWWRLLKLVFRTLNLPVGPEKGRNAAMFAARSANVPSYRRIRPFQYAEREVCGCRRIAGYVDERARRTPIRIAV